MNIHRHIKRIDQWFYLYNITFEGNDIINVSVHNILNGVCQNNILPYDAMDRPDFMSDVLSILYTEGVLPSV